MSSRRCSEAITLLRLEYLAQNEISEAEIMQNSSKSDIIRCRVVVFVKLLTAPLNQHFHTLHGWGTFTLQESMLQFYISSVLCPWRCLCRFSPQFRNRRKLCHKKNSMLTFLKCLSVSIAERVSGHEDFKGVTVLCIASFHQRRLQ
jgi:hypothetical protein